MHANITIRQIFDDKTRIDGQNKSPAAQQLEGFYGDYADFAFYVLVPTACTSIAMFINRLSDADA